MGDQDSLWNLDDPTLVFMWLGVFVTCVGFCFFILDIILDYIKERKRMRGVKMSLTTNTQGLAGIEPFWDEHKQRLRKQLDGIALQQALGDEQGIALRQALGNGQGIALRQALGNEQGIALRQAFNSD